MGIDIVERSDGRILEVNACEKLSRSDYRRFAPRFEKLIKQHGKIRILFSMENFRGWKAAALWDDIKMDWKYLNAIERLAIVGSKRWQKWMSRVCQPFSSAEIRYFDRGAAGDARIWIESDSERTARAPVLRAFQSRDQTRAYYNKISRFYDLLSDRTEAPVRKAGLDLLNAAAGEKILEIGFGTGHTLVALARAVGPKGRVFGIDLSNRMVQLARKRLADAGLSDRARLRCGDAAQLPYSADSMDAAFFCFTLELFDTPEIPRVLGECRRTLRPGGRIVVVGMSKEGGREPLVGVFEWTHRHFPKFVDCRPIYVRESLSEAGFMIRKSLIKHMWIPVEIVAGLKSQSGDPIHIQRFAEME